MALPPKLCPSCREEYLHTAETCVHCEVALVVADALPADAPVEELPPASELRSVRVASAGWAVSLSDRLVEAEIPHRVEPVEADRDESPYGVYVREEDLEAAREIDARHVEYQMPDLPDAADLPSHGDDACPACGADIAADAGECAECGISILPAE